MAYSKVLSAQPGALHATLVTVETDVAVGIYNFMIVGLPGKEVDESKDRVAAAIKNSGIPSPKSENRKIVTSLSPAHVRKEGSHFDLPIALGYLKATGYLDFPVNENMFVGELSLSGDVLPVSGVLSIALLSKQHGIKNIFVPEKNKYEAALVSGINIFPVKNLRQIVGHLKNETLIPKEEYIKEIKSKKNSDDDPFMYIKGQDTAKRALIIAASGGHNIALYGPPGTGKTMLARAFCDLLPQLTREAMLEVTSIHSYAGVLGESLVTDPPFRSPHHSASHTSLVGGGSNIRPGEITLAHRGVLFLDEFPEFERKTIEALRQPIEEGEITVSRAKGTIKYPARSTLIVAMNPCPCGFKGSPIKECVCKDHDIKRYERKISGPIVDRIDLWIEVPHVEYKDLTEKTQKKKSDIKQKIQNAREIQKKRFGTDRQNAHMRQEELEKFIALGKDVEEILVTYSKKFGLSPRSFNRMKKIARTIADLEGEKDIQKEHILEAFQYRPKMKE